MRFLEYKGFDLEDFYVVSIRTNEISFQGSYTSDKVKKYQNILNSNFSINSEGHCGNHNRHFNIILT